MAQNDPAPMTAPADQTYRGEITDPALWAGWTPRRGDILVCTPAKSGTTWTQSILVNLLHGCAPPAPVSKMSPWIDATLTDPAEARAALTAQPGRRVVKTHTPGDGVPVWDGVHVVAVYRHPLDVFLSLRKHIANMVDRSDDHPMKQPLEMALDTFLNRSFREDDVDGDSLALIVAHHARTVLSGRFPHLTVLHYADMIADHRGTVERLALSCGIPADADLIDRVTAKTQFAAMKARAGDFAPEAGIGLWKDETAFFAEGGTGKWAGTIPDESLAAFRNKLKQLQPDPSARHWLETGGTSRDN